MELAEVVTNPPDLQDCMLATMQSFAQRRCVESIDGSMCPEFQEFSIVVKLRPCASSREIIRLRNDILARMEQRYAIVEGEAPMTWQISFWRGTTRVEVLFPGDGPLNERDMLCC